MDLYRAADAKPGELRFKVYHPHVPLPLSDVLPMLEHMGLKVIDEAPHAIRPKSDTHKVVMIHDFGLVVRGQGNKEVDNFDLKAVRASFHDVFGRSWSGEMESDGLNALVINGGLGWREVVVLRHFSRYLRQVKAPFSQEYMIQALNNNPRIAADIARMFVAKFDPKAKKREAEVETYRKNILSALESVTSADEDRVLRRFLNVVESALRTNYYQNGADGQPKSYLSVKFDSTKIDEMPLPRPLREIFVYSPRVEAIHLRGGLVARGGIRWSDRLEDFRTEVLGLMKAQMVKNAVIVPVGSKGGFTVKRPPLGGGRDAIAAEGVACYRMFMSGLLDITDNLKNGKVIPPNDVVRIDGDDPYLVVAADKGTATFSDIANGIALDYGFWLGDAFASGGSVGYDHKKMGITARGAWESVKRHFREMGKDIQTEDFICVGVGDMSGDVFGNGMMLSEHTKLIGAFNHLHIFVDPDPDPSTSFKERVRMFNLARSSWSDYDTKVLSKGGGIYDRKAKSIALSPEARARFGIAKASVTPNELIKIMLQADIELLFFGGIGTYIKASHETHADADDRSNDAVRVDADTVRAKVIGEGANLGVTQRARIEYALVGGRLNADSIDNSAGVDTSDHEVNIKILLDAVVAKKKLTYAQRNVQLAKLTDELAGLVLRDNYMQSQAITLSQAKSAALLDLQQRFVRLLERNGRLDRVIEFLPDDETWAERAARRIGLTRPEIAIVMPYSKMWLYDTLLASDLPDDPLLEADLVTYFPSALRVKYRKEILSHQLRREIIATVATNSMINRVGGTFCMNLIEKTGAAPVDVARAYIVVRDAFDLRSIWSAIEGLDAKVHADVQIKLFADIEQLIERVTLWLLRNVPAPIDMSKAIAEFGPKVRELAAGIEKFVPAEVTDNIEFRVKRYTDQGVPVALAKRIAYTILLVSAPDIIRADAQSKKSLGEIARLYFRIGETFGLGWLRYNAEKLPADTHWQKLAAAAVIEELYAHQKNLTLRMMNGSGDSLESWSRKNTAAVDQMKQMLTELKTADPVDLSMLAVASRHLSALSNGG
jgi:glutamate dehydrogenase